MITKILAKDYFDPKGFCASIRIQKLYSFRRLFEKRYIVDALYYEINF